MRKSTWIIILFLLITAGITGWIVWPIFFAPDSAPPPPSAKLEEVREARAFIDVTQTAGFTHIHHKPYLDPKLDGIMSWMVSVGAAAAAGDFDNDGFVDLYVTDSKKGEPNYLYRNQGLHRKRVWPKISMTILAPVWIVYGETMIMMVT